MPSTLTFDVAPAYSELVFDAPPAISVLTFDALPVYTSPVSTDPTGTLAPPTSVAYAGESLIRETIKQIASDTKAFELCWIGSRLDFANQPAAATEFSVQPKGTRQTGGYDAAPDWTRIFSSTFRLAIYVKNPDPEQRDAIATNLLDLMRKKLDGQSIAGLTVPDCTKITDWNWHGDQASVASMTPTRPDIAPPIRELEATFVCEWIDSP